ncbi:type II secretion system minor pseudopilin GspK [Yersinia massiliensis]|uniref:type II secretion system minor pseudopilin GspK n=1 Tax=Yersinia massiliensis TaxID=419257 RepID=UPI000314D536|nr:type II secretion system minor pseudopilin GspK [Yersinia massiliensis]
MRNHNQQGMALLVVLMITALMTMIAVNMNDYGLRAVNRATSTQFQLQTKWLLLSAESLVKRQQLSSLPVDKIHLGQSWARADQQMVLDGNPVNFSLRDRQACFNLNGIGQNRGTEGEKETSDKVYSQQVFHSLLLTLGLDATQAKNMTLALVDWIDKDDLARQGGRESAQYRDHQPKLMPANRPMLNISEFRVLAGVDQALYLRLKPMICTLPTQNLRINVNTLSPAQAPLLAALFLGEMSVETAQQLIAARPANGWQSVNDLKRFTLDSSTAFTQAQTAITLTSDHFELSLWLDEEQRNNRIRSQLQRDGHVFHVISRQYGLSD